MTYRMAALVLAAASLVSAADTADWGNLRELKKGERIGVIRSDMKRIEGKFESATETAIVVMDDQPVTLSKESVVRVYRRPRMNRGIRTVVGAAIGTAAGAVVDGTLGAYMRNESSGPDAGLITGLGAAAGAGVGAASGGGYRTIYQRR